MFGVWNSSAVREATLFPRPRVPSRGLSLLFPANLSSCSLLAVQIINFETHATLKCHGHLTTLVPIPFPLSEKTEPCVSVSVPTPGPDAVWETLGFLHRIPLPFLVSLTTIVTTSWMLSYEDRAAWWLEHSFWSQTNMASDLYCTTYYLLDIGTSFFLSLSLSVVICKMAELPSPHRVASLHVKCLVWVKHSVHNGSCR